MRDDSELLDPALTRPEAPRAAVLHAPGDIRVESRARGPLAPWQARVRVNMAAVCGTDRALAAGELPAPLPLVLGHEFVGTVIGVGDPGARAWIGRRVCADINTTCVSRGEPTPCRACRLGLEHHCQRREVTGIGGTSGAFADELVTATANLVAVPEGERRVSDRAAMFAEPLAAAIQAFEQVPVGPGDVVAVLGCGRLGALVAAVARRRGAEVIAVGRTPAKLARCERLGVGQVVALGAEGDAGLRARIDAMTGGLGADVVVEATGVPRGLALAQALVRPRGTIVLKTTCGLPPEGFDLTRAVVDEVTLVGSRCGPMARALELLAAGDLDVAALVEETYPLRQVAEAIERAGHAFKVAVEPGRE